MVRPLRLVTLFFPPALAFLLVFVPVIALANRARFWWQELIVNHALLLLVSSVASVAYLCLRSRPRPAYRCVQVLSLMLLTYHAVFVGHLLSPYVTGSRRQAGDGQERLSLGYIQQFSSLPDLLQFSDRFNPHILIAQDFPISNRAAVAERFPYTKVASNDNLRGILIASRFSVLDDVATSLGVSAYPGAVVRIRVNRSFAPLLGVLALKPSRNQESLERNRITSRRLASVMRNGVGPRIAVLGLSTTPWSQFSYIFQEQTDMKSMLEHSGWREYIAIDKPYGIKTLHNIFVSPELNCVRAMKEVALDEQMLVSCQVPEYSD